jgi:hypothetical protein
MDITQKCQNCGKYFFIEDGEIECPFCGKKESNFFDIFTDMFGNHNNPFSDFGAT